MNAQDSLGNRGVLRRIQAKLQVSQPGDPQENEAVLDHTVVPSTSALRISSPDDPAELEAERVAAEVMRMPAPSTSPELQRKCAACDDEEKVHRSATSESPGTAPSIVNQVLSQPGQPLPDSTRSFFEPRMDADLSAVRIHTDTQAARSADAVQAKAYTVGSSIAFADGQYAPQSDSGRELLAHELVHVSQQARASTASHLIRRDGGVPAPAQPAASNHVEYHGHPLFPIVEGTLLTADPDQVSGQLRTMIIEHGIQATSVWVDGLDGALTGGASPNVEAEQKKYGKGDVSGAPDPMSSHKRQVVAEFKRSRDKWNTIADSIMVRFDREIVASVNGLLDQSQAQIEKEARRYGISLDPTGNKLGGPSFLPVPPEREALKKAATQILVEWRKKDKQKTVERALLAAPTRLYEIERAFDNMRRDKIREFPILAAYAMDKEKLSELAAQKDPGANLEKDMNARLDNIAWVRAHVEDRKDQLKLDPRIRNAAKRAMLAPPRSVEDRVIEDQIKNLQADQETAEQLKMALGFALLVMAFVPGMQLPAGVIGGAMMVSDLKTRFEDYFWEEAASGTAFNRAAAISQSDPSLFRLGFEIAFGIAQGVVEVTVIGKAVETFKALAPVVREALAARAAARAARSVAARVAADEALTRLDNSGESGLTKRLRRAIEKGEFDKDGPAIAEAARASDAAAAAGEVKGLPDAFSKETHTVRITREGNIRCSAFCMELADSILHRLEQFGLENLTEDQRAAGQGLVAEARQARLKAATVAEGTAEEAALEGDIKRIESSMVDLERGIGMALKQRLGITRDYAGELRTARDRVSTILEQHRGKPGYGEMQRSCGEISNTIAEMQGGFDKVQRSLETGRPPAAPMDAYRSTVDGLLKGLDELDKRIGGIEREQLSQLQATSEGGELYGKSDADTRNKLGEKLGRTGEQMADEKISDVVAKKKDGSWIVTESKGGNIYDAVNQLQNTIRLLQQAEPKAAGRIQARVTVTPEAFTKLQLAEGLQGYCVGPGGRLEVGVPGSSKPYSIPGTQGAVTVQAF